MDFPGGTIGKESTYKAGDTRDAGLISGSGRSPGGRQGNPPQDSFFFFPRFLSRESRRQKSLMGYSPEGRKELDMTKATEHRANTHNTYILKCMYTHTCK